MMGHEILVVDDDPDIRKMMSQFLGTVAEVVVAATGEEALRLIAERRPPLMLLDMVMPGGMSGLEVLKAARELSVAMTIIMLTSENDVELAKQCLEWGAVEYVTKPFDLPQLKEKVKRSLKAAPRDAKDVNGVPWRTVVAPDQTKTP